MEKEWEGRGEREQSFYMCVPGDRRDWMDCLCCWVLFSVGGKGEHVPGASFYEIPVWMLLPGIVFWNRHKFLFALRCLRGFKMEWTALPLLISHCSVKANTRQFSNISNYKESMRWTGTFQNFLSILPFCFKSKLLHRRWSWLWVLISENLHPQNLHPVLALTESSSNCL